MDAPDVFETAVGVLLNNEADGFTLANSVLQGTTGGNGETYGVSNDLQFDPPAEITISDSSFSGWAVAVRLSANQGFMMNGTGLSVSGNAFTLNDTGLEVDFYDSTTVITGNGFWNNNLGGGMRHLYVQIDGDKSITASGNSFSGTGVVRVAALGTLQAEQNWCPRSTVEQALTLCRLRGGQVADLDQVPDLRATHRCHPRSRPPPILESTSSTALPSPSASSM